MTSWQCLVAVFAMALLQTQMQVVFAWGPSSLGLLRASSVTRSGSVAPQRELRREPGSRTSWTMMAARGGGGTKLDTRVKQDTATKLRDEIEKDYRLILHDDTVHTIQQVCEILGACCPLCSGPRAYEVTLEVHMTGAGTVAVANKKIIEEYCKSLQQAGLTVSMAPDDDFEAGEGEE